jgi:hypothetical protein
MSGATGRKPLDYAAIKDDYAPIKECMKQAWQRRMAGFDGLVFKARPLQPAKDDEGIGCKVAGDPEPLIDYLRGDGPLSDDDRESLAGLIEQYADLIKRKLRRNGRPRGSITPKTAATECASCLVRIGKAAWCRKHGRKRAPKALTPGLIERAIELMEAEIPEARAKISAEAVEDGSYLRPDPKTEEYIDIDLEEAKREIIELALK